MPWDICNHHALHMVLHEAKLGSGGWCHSPHQHAGNDGVAAGDEGGLDARHAVDAARDDAQGQQNHKYFEHCHAPPRQQPLRHL